MSESDGEQAARSLALEQAYVHEVYEQCAERTVPGRHWPRICQFLEELEPGALVCDIGCGNGKYLNVNHNVFKVGADRCKRFANIAREKENEVLACDNLSLPFRDESFDAVLSIAVVHHFSTTERRVRALKELARVLRIGGRLIISVWAMEQKHRKFESQDVLVPWPKAYCISSSGSPIKPRGMSYDERHRGKNAQTYLLSKRNGQKKGSKNKSYWIDPIFSPSPSTSSLSSPNETCYSFFRRALQKLAGGRRGSRAWFLENWQNGKTQRHSYEDEDDGDVDNLPIELRRLEDHAGLPIPKKSQLQHSDSLSVKSKSLSNIEEVQRLELVRSRSSIPGLCNTAETQEQEQRQQSPAETPPTTTTTTTTTTTMMTKPRLVKQKTHFNDDACCADVPESTAIQQILKDIPELQVPASPSSASKPRNVHKQSSMNEELMSIERLKERESVRKNIMKQASLNEELIYKSRPTLDALRDTFYSGSATKRFQLLKSGLTSRLKQSTTNIEKVSGMSIKNGFVRILQSWKSTESPASATTTTTTTEQSKCQTPQTKLPAEGIERRPSREDGSDSSKDSSLQSDTSVDSEDSFASVIYVPKKSSSPLVEVPAPLGYQLSTTSAPPSPRFKYAPEPPGGAHRLKLISPLLKQFPATSKSLPPPSPPGLSPRTLNSGTMRPFFSGAEVAAGLPQSAQSATLIERIAEVKRSFDAHPPPKMPSLVKPTSTETTSTSDHRDMKVTTPSLPKQLSEDRPESKRATLQAFRGYRSMSSTLEPEKISPLVVDDGISLSTDAIDEALERLSEKSLSSSDSLSASTTEEDETRRSQRLNQIKELLREKPGFASRSKPAFPIVRRASSATTSSGRLEQVSKLLPRLLSLELFNPETDDLDSDSSGVSSPESVGSVISVISDERYLKKEQNEKSEEGSSDGSKDNDKKDEDNELSLTNQSTDDSDSLIEVSTGSSQSLKLLAAAANVATTLEDAVGTLIQKSEATKSGASGAPMPSQETTTSPERPVALDKRISPVESTWNEECNRHLIDLTDRLSGNLIHDIDQFCRRTKLEDEEMSGLTSTRYTSSCKYDSGLKQQPQLQSRQASRDNDYCDLDNNTQRSSSNDDDSHHTADSCDTQLLIQRSCSEDSDAGSSSGGFVCVTNSGEFLTERELRRTQQPPRSGNSIESSDIGDSIENTISDSSVRRFCTGSTASLASSSSARVRLCTQTRSASEEIPRAGAQRQKRSTTSASNGTLSGSSSQESLPSDQITYHQYYHVFREGELDQLINKYVENLHIISSYYDHASWCIVAEKVQVWTI